MNPAEHLKNLHSLLLRLVQKNVRINGTKCKIAQTSIPFLGFTIDATGIHPNRKCMSAWVESKPPTNFAELRRITSALQYYSRFVPHFAAKADCRQPFRSSGNCSTNNDSGAYSTFLQRMLLFVPTPPIYSRLSSLMVVLSCVFLAD